MKHQFSRNELAIGQEGLDLLKNKTVAVLGVGGVGSFAAEALARTNIGHIILIDKDDVDITNVNRQIHALTSTIGQSKVTLGVKVVFSDESPIVIREDVKETVGDKNAINRKGQMPPSSNAFVPSVVGLICASYVVNDILKDIPVRRIKDKGLN